MFQIVHKVLFKAAVEGVKQLGTAMMRKRFSYAHILVLERELLDNIIEQLRRGADFHQLAMQHSKCPSRSAGGELGKIAPEEFISVVERKNQNAPRQGSGRGIVSDNQVNTALEQLQPGDVTAFRTAYGYHAVKRTG